MIRKQIDRDQFFNCHYQHKTNGEIYQHIQRHSNPIKDSIQPFRTQDPEVWKIARYLNLPLSDNAVIQQKAQLSEPSVTFKETSEETPPVPQAHYDSMCVGGPHAAVTAYQHASQGSRVLYIYKGSPHATIESGSAYHGEFDTPTEQSLASTGRYGPHHFMAEIISRTLFPRFYSNSHQSQFPWKSLNIMGWLGHWTRPACFFRNLNEAAQVFWGNYKNYQYYKANPQARAQAWQETSRAIQASDTELQRIDAELKAMLGAGIFQASRGSVYIGKTHGEQRDLEQKSQTMAFEDKILEPVDNKKAQRLSGVNADGKPYLKHSDKTFSPYMMQRLRAGIHNQGGECRQFQLTQIWDNNVAELIDPQTQQPYYVSADHIETSLGATLYEPQQTPMISATGTSITGYVKGELNEVPIVCGGTNHLTPLGPTQWIDGKPYTPARLTCAASMGPRDLGNSRYMFQGLDAVNALRQTEFTLKQSGLEFVPVEARGCHRPVSAKHFTEINPAKFRSQFSHSIFVTSGPGGGGLTGSAIPKQAPRAGR